LTVVAARARGLPIAGVVVNETTPLKGEVERKNVEELRKRLDVPLLGVVPYQTTPYPDWEVGALGGVDWQSLGKR
jgi:dethiobiotin synthetase